MDEKKLSSAARRQIMKEQELTDAALQSELKQLRKKLYWEEFRYNTYLNIRQDFPYIVGGNVAAAILLRSIVIVPIGLIGIGVIEMGRAWKKTE